MTQVRPSEVCPVPHDPNHAARYGTRVIAVKEGAVVAQGSPPEIVTADLVEEVFGPRCRAVPEPVSGTPSFVPLGRGRSGRS